MDVSRPYPTAAPSLITKRIITPQFNFSEFGCVVIFQADPKWHYHAVKAIVYYQWARQHCITYSLAEFRLGFLHANFNKNNRYLSSSTMHGLTKEYWIMLLVVLIP